MESPTSRTSISRVCSSRLPSSKTSGSEAQIRSQPLTLHALNVTGPPSSGITEFIWFPKLPLELRDKIWELSMPCARVIEIRWEEDRGKYITYTPSALSSDVFLSCSEARACGLRKYDVLEFENNIDVAAWTEGLDEYYESTGWWDQISDIDENEGEEDKDETGDEDGYVTIDDAPKLIHAVAMFRTYIDYSRDTLYLTSAHTISNTIAGSPAHECLLWHLSEIPEISSKIRRIAFQFDAERGCLIAASLFEFEKLETLVVVCGEDCCERIQNDCDCKTAPRLVKGGHGTGTRKSPPVNWPKGQRFSLDWYETRMGGLREAMEEEVMQHKAFKQYGDANTIEEWNALKMVLRFVVRTPHLLPYA